MSPFTKLADVKTPDPYRQKRIRSVATPETLNGSEEIFARAYVESQGNVEYALTQAGYSFKDQNSARNTANGILRKIDRACDIGAVFEMVGKGKLHWVMSICRLVESENLKAVAVGARLHGLAMQYFTATAPQVGASITVNTLSTNGTPATGQMVQVSIGGQPPQQP